MLTRHGAQRRRPASTGARFFELVLAHTLQGTFGDPFYGGNANFVGLGSDRLSRACGWPSPPSSRTSTPRLRPRTCRPTTTRCSRRRRREPAASTISNMATDRRTDVVIIGLGATGGVAALPLAQAGLDVVGLEAGTWLSAGRLCRPTSSATTSAAGRSRCRRRIARFRRTGRTRRRRTRRGPRFTR